MLMDRYKVTFRIQIFQRSFPLPFLLKHITYYLYWLGQRFFAALIVVMFRERTDQLVYLRSFNQNRFQFLSFLPPSNFNWLPYSYACLYFVEQIFFSLAINNFAYCSVIAFLVRCNFFIFPVSTCTHSPVMYIISEYIICFLSDQNFKNYTWNISPFSFFLFFLVKRQ